MAEICRSHRLQRVRELGLPGFVLVEAAHRGAATEARLRLDPRVEDVERDEMPESLEVRRPSLARPSTEATRDLLFDRSAIDFFGEWAWVGFVDQPSGQLIGVGEVHQDRHTGRGITVAVIDTGIDPRHPVLGEVLVSGYDFTRDRPGLASDWPDLDSSAAAILNQSTAAILDQSTAAILDQSTAAILDGSQVVVLSQSTAAILDSETASALKTAGPLPAAFGHGTMVAGLVHLVAPEARIMPLKAFHANGSSRPSDIIRAIFFAVEQGAKIINMSFSLEKAPRGVRWAVGYATLRGVICVASAGNQNQETLVYPAALLPVVGVASTTLEDARAPFSNFGARLVTVAAPGVNLVTTYPTGRYATVSGTSYSTAFVSGATALLAGVNPRLRPGSVNTVFRSSWYISKDLGHGRIDLTEAVAAASRPPRWRR